MPLQVPQFILDQLWSQGRPCRILCTQPRRISASSGWFVVLYSYFRMIAKAFFKVPNMGLGWQWLNELQQSVENQLARLWDIR